MGLTVDIEQQEAVVAAQQTFFQQLREIWSQNPAVSILHARLRPRDIPSETLQYAMNMQQSFQFQQQLNQSINAQLGAVGVFGGGGGGVGSGYGDPDQMMFLGTMGLVRAHEGDPPATRALASHAAAILRGQIDPMQAFALGSVVPGAGELIGGLAAFIGDMGPLLRLQGTIMAALAVPREQIPDLLGMPEELNRDDADLALLGGAEQQVMDEEAFERAMLAAQHALGRHDFGRAETELAGALAAAERTTTADDDIQAIDHMMLLAYKSNVAPESLVLCVHVLDELAERDERRDDLARIAAGLAVLSHARGIDGDVGPDITRIGRALLERGVASPYRLPLALAVAGMLHRAGSTEHAEQLLADVEPGYTDADDRIDIAMLRADFCRDGDDRVAATDVLLRVLDEADGAGTMKRLGAVKKLVSVWPDERDGVDAWLDEILRIAGDLDDPQRSLALVTAVLALMRAKKMAEAVSLSARVDLEEAERQLPESLQGMLQQIRDAFGQMDA
ncbi:MAG: hypothetical protein P8Z36_05080 [Gemmatimonadota bacterium]